MPTLVHAEIPSTEFALADTLQTRPDMKVSCERLVERPNDTVLPLLWVHDTSLKTLDSDLEQDPSVDTFSRLTQLGDEALYEMSWRTNIRLILQMLTNQALILNATGEKRRWELRVLFPNRDTLTETHDFCNEREITFEITRVHDLNERSDFGAQFGLTSEQFDALTRAFEQGYFEVPREATLEDLATDLDISHQALSERLRRAHKTVISEILHARAPKQH
jgi:predicted DNA binding protein